MNHFHAYLVGIKINEYFHSIVANIASLWRSFGLFFKILLYINYLKNFYRFIDKIHFLVNNIIQNQRFSSLFELN